MSIGWSFFPAPPSPATAKRAFCSTPRRISLATRRGVGVFGNSFLTRPRERLNLPWRYHRRRRSISFPPIFTSISHMGRKRSEEHTSELQSRLHLVCRLLLEKKKKNRTEETSST